MTTELITQPKIIKVHGEYLTMNHYKEPLKSVKRGQGYGFYGAILLTPDGAKVQCHMCGKLFESLYGHIQMHHKITQKEYKLKYDLSPMTALISEKQRMKSKQAMLDYLKTLTPEEKEAYRQRQVARLKKVRHLRDDSAQPKASLEQKNKRGVCPDQLLAKIEEVKLQLGHAPSLSEFIVATGGQRYKHLIFATFGSWNKALSLIGEQPRPRTGGRVNGGNQYINKYDPDYLLELLTIYAQENKKIPTMTDCKRGLIPDYNVYARAFGSFNKARELAGVYEIVDEDVLKKFKKRSHPRPMQVVQAYA